MSNDKSYYGHFGKPYIKQKWIDDKTTNNCKKCHYKFNFYKRKHHSRLYEEIFCSDYCNNESSSYLISLFKNLKYNITSDYSPYDINLLTINKETLYGHSQYLVHLLKNFPLEYNDANKLNNIFNHKNIKCEILECTDCSNHLNIHDAINILIHLYQSNKLNDNLNALIEFCLSFIDPNSAFFINYISILVTIISKSTIIFKWLYDICKMNILYLNKFYCELKYNIEIFHIIYSDYMDILIEI